MAVVDQPARDINVRHSIAVKQQFLFQRTEKSCGEGQRNEHEREPSPVALKEFSLTVHVDPLSYDSGPSIRVMARQGHSEHHLREPGRSPDGPFKGSGNLRFAAPTATVGHR